MMELLGEMTFKKMCEAKCPIFEKGYWLAKSEHRANKKLRLQSDFLSEVLPLD